MDAQNFIESGNCFGYHNTIPITLLKYFAYLGFVFLLNEIMKNLIKFDFTQILIVKLVDAKKTQNCNLTLNSICC